MGLLGGLMGHASEVDIKEVAKEFEPVLADGKVIEVAYRVIRDMFVFTNKRLILLDKQGITGKKLNIILFPIKA